MLGNSWIADQLVASQSNAKFKLENDLGAVTNLSSELAPSEC
jgi:hypothetical protein